MKKLRLFVCIGWLLVIAHALLGCGKQEADLQPEPQSPAPAAARETEPGYISTELDMPAWLDSWEGCEIVGERFYLGGHTADGGLAAACYDTGSGQWQRFDLERGELQDPSIESFSASENAVWMLLLESGSYALSYRDLDSGETSCAPLTFWREGDPYFSCLAALDGRSGADGEAPWLFSIDYDFAMGAGIASRMKLDGDYRPVGFPGAEGAGSYFTRLGIAKTQGGVGRYDYDESMFTVGGSTSLGILASGEDRDGAWRFVRAFILGEEEPELSRGIPVLKESFERVVQAELDKKQEDVGYAPFNESDAQALRELVLGTEKMTCSDKAVLDAMRTVLSGYLDGLNSAEGAARQLQSRLSLYMAERA